MIKNITEETKNKYRRLRQAAKKAVARAMKEEAVRKINDQGINSDNVSRHVRKMKMEITDVIGGRCMQGNDGIHYLNEKDRANL